MYSTFGRGFSYGYKHSFNKQNFSTFFKKSCNNKYMFSMFNSCTNSPKSLINFSNKCFMNKAIFLDNNPNQITDGLGSKTLSGEMKNGAEMEKLENETTQMGEGLSMIQGLFLVRHGKLNVNIDREVVEHLDPVANWEVHDRSSSLSTCE